MSVCLYPLALIRDIFLPLDFRFHAHVVVSTFVSSGKSWSFTGIHTLFFFIRSCYSSTTFVHPSLSVAIASSYFMGFNWRVFSNPPPSPAPTPAISSSIIAIYLRLAWYPNSTCVRAIAVKSPYLSIGLVSRPYRVT